MILLNFITARMAEKSFKKIFYTKKLRFQTDFFFVSSTKQTVAREESTSLDFTFSSSSVCENFLKRITEMCFSCSNIPPHFLSSLLQITCLFVCINAFRRLCLNRLRRIGLKRYFFSL